MKMSKNKPLIQIVLGLLFFFSTISLQARLTEPQRESSSQALSQKMNKKTCVDRKSNKVKPCSIIKETERLCMDSAGGWTQPVNGDCPNGTPPVLVKLEDDTMEESQEVYH